MGNAVTQELSSSLVRHTHPLALLQECMYNYVRVEEYLADGRGVVTNAIVAEAQQLSTDIEFGKAGAFVGRRWRR